MVELMATLAVLAILVVAAAPSFSDFVDRTRLKKAASGIVDFINDTRADSVKRGRNISVAFGGTVSAWCVGANAPAESSISPGDVVPDAAVCDCTTSGACTVGGEARTFDATGNGGVKLSAVPAAAITFDGRTGVEAALSTLPVTLVSASGKYRLRLTVTPLGQTTICVPDGSRSIAGYSSC